MTANRDHKRPPRSPRRIEQGGLTEPRAAGMFSASEIGELLDLVSELARERRSTPAIIIQDLIDLHLERKTTRARLDLYFGEFAGRLRRLRIRRNASIGADLFRDPAWDMLLELFHAHSRGRDLSLKSLWYSSGAPATTAQRKLALLEEYGLVTCETDEQDSRGQVVRPSQSALELVGRTMSELVEYVDAMRHDLTKAS